MKTNQLMKRPMGQFEVIQRTSDGFFSATSLLKLWNDTFSDEKRSLDNFWKITNLDKLMSEIAENEMNFKSVEFTELKNMLSKTQRGKVNGVTWMHPYLFIKFAMWINPKFKLQVIKFVYDEMIKYRNMAGDAYRRLAEAISRLVGKDRMKEFMPQVAKAVNLIVFGNHESNERNKHGNEKLQRELFRFEIKVAELIEEGFIKSEKELTQYLRKKWDEKFVPKVLKQEEDNK